MIVMVTVTGAVMVTGTGAVMVTATVMVTAAVIVIVAALAVACADSDGRGCAPLWCCEEIQLSIPERNITYEILHVCVCACVCVGMQSYNSTTPSLLPPYSVLFLVVFTSDDPIMSVLQVEVTCQVVRPER